MTHFRTKAKGHEPLPDPATIVVVGGGPAGAFFAMAMLKRARQLGKTVDLLILEKKKEVHFYASSRAVAYREGCNHCAGGISPRLADVLRDDGLTLPEDLLTGTVDLLAVHGDWKSIELPIPEGRQMLSVFRGSRPISRLGSHVNFDSYMLNKAVEAGARVITGEVHTVSYSSAGKPVLTYQAAMGIAAQDERVEADFAVIAVGVNETPGMHPESGQLVRSLQSVIPRFRPPQVRKTLICEIETTEESIRHMKGEVHFVQFGSRDLRIEMSSLIPKGRYITVALIGRSVDTADPPDRRDLVARFLELPHIKRLLPGKVRLTPVCACNPSMTVGAARNPSGHRIAVIGDMVVSRLYKDGIYSAYLTASALANSIADGGIDATSLKKTYWPVIRQLKKDNRFGALVFLLSRVTFSRPMLSRVLYQAFITETKTRPKGERRLANVLWRIASGDDAYQSILASMFHPSTIARIGTGGVLVTIRNCLADLLFGQKWGAFGRYATGVPKEDVEEKRRELFGVAGIRPSQRPPEFERMYSIKIRAARARVWRQLGKFGDKDREYFRPRMIDVHRASGCPNEVGSIIQYDVFPRRLSFSVVLEKAVEERYLVYRVRSGFPKGGMLVFDLGGNKEEICLLSIYVAFDFPKGSNWLKKVMWCLFRFGFPAFIHDVLWNHALCHLKALAEGDR